jgi:hypothetical protein
MSHNSKPIPPPQLHPARALGRAAFEGIFELIPGAGLLTNIYAVTHPPVEEIDRRRWEDEMTLRSNEQDDAIKRVISAFLNMKENHEHANRAQHLSFLRGGMITTLEAIGRDGLAPDLETELNEKLEVTAEDVEDLLQGLDAALLAMTDKERNREFAQILHETVFGSFGKSSIRRDIAELLRSRASSVEVQQKRALAICESIDRFNVGLRRLSNYAVGSVEL